MYEHIRVNQGIAHYLNKLIYNTTDVVKINTFGFMNY